MRKSGWLVAVMAVFVFAVVAAGGLALVPNRANGEEPESHPEPLGPTPAQTKEFLESGRAGRLVEEPETDLHAAQAMPHRDLGRGAKRSN
jgi:hypothetical protein